MNKFECAACKYMYEDEWQDGKRVTVKGDEQPKLIILSNGINVQIYNPEPFSDNEDIRLYACPKCNTVKIEIE